MGDAEDRQGPPAGWHSIRRRCQLSEPAGRGSFRSGSPQASATRTGDLVCCLLDGRPLHPKTFSYYFGRHVRRLGLPRIRLHDLRHTHATLALRAGVHPRVVQERLGHANVSITLDTYSHVDLDMQAIAAARVATLVTGDPK